MTRIKQIITDFITQPACPTKYGLRHSAERRSKVSVIRVLFISY